MRGLVLRPMVASDAGEVMTVQRAAFLLEAQLYRDPDLPPLVEGIDEICALDDAHRGVVAVLGQRLVGSIRVRVDGRRLHLGRLSVAPDLQGRGIGAALLAAGEAVADADEALLFTGHLSAGNLRLYERAGYREERRERFNDRTVLVHLRKVLTASAQAREFSIRTSSAASSTSSDAAALSRMDAGLEAPGIGMTTGARDSSQASTT